MSFLLFAQFHKYYDERFSQDVTLRLSSPTQTVVNHSHHERYFEKLHHLLVILLVSRSYLLSFFSSIILLLQLQLSLPRHLFTVGVLMPTLRPAQSRRLVWSRPRPLCEYYI